MGSNVFLEIRCPCCKFTSKQEKKFYAHLKNQHQIDDPEQLYISAVLGGTRPTCQCSPTCNRPVKWTGWKRGYLSKYVKGHNAIIDSCFTSPEMQKKIHKKRVEGIIEGRTRVWNAGLTKENDERVLASSAKISKTLKEGYETGRIIDWRTLNPEKARVAVEQMSSTKKQKFASGELKSWNEGLTKHDDVRLVEVGKNISKHRAEHRDTCRRLTNDELLERAMALEGLQLLTPIDDYRNMHRQDLLFKCTTCEHEFEKTLDYMERNPKCTKCGLKDTDGIPRFVSRGQLEVYDFVKMLTPTVFLSDRTMISPLEIDVLVPGRLAIEFDGLWWHSDRFKPTGYATQKMKACKDAGLHLFSIFEDEWVHKQEIIKSMIKHRLGCASQSIGARKCKIVELSTQDRRKFMNDNHLDGDVNSTIAWGLEFDGKMVAALSLRRPFHKTNADFYEVARFCLAHDVNIQGALSRLSRHALRWSLSQGKVGLLTYVDERIGHANGYIKAGFKVKHETQPRFYWTDFCNRFDRFSVRANSKEGITEAMAAQEKGVTKIWSCPNLVLELRE